MANVIDGVKYTKEHEWIRVEGDTAVEGLTDYAQSELSDIVMVELPAAGRKVKAGDAIGTIEAVKAVSDLYAGLSGEVTEVNEDLADTPEKINESPYEEGWMIRVRIEDESELETLLSADAYSDVIG